MQKAKIMCLILAMVMASVGTVVVAQNLTDSPDVPIIPSDSLNATLDRPQEGDPSSYDAIQNLYIAQGELQRKGGFVGVTRGTTTSAGISQTVINNRTVINGNVFKEMITVGAVKNAYQLYMYGDNYLYRKFKNIKNADNITWDTTASKYSKDDFLGKFGHRSDSLTGYILNDDTIVSGVLEKEEDGLFTYRYVLDTEQATAAMLYEMRANSNMSGFSTFIKAEIIVVMDAEWQVKTVSTDCKYKVPMFGGVNCVEDITETFHDLTSEDLPEKDFFEQFFNAEVTTPVVEDPDALSILMNIFEPYVAGNNLNVSFDAQNGGQSLVSGLLSANIDIENISNIAVDAKIGDDLYLSYEQGKLYVKYQDFVGSATVDGIMGLVNSFMPSTVGEAGLSLDLDSMLDKFNYQITDDLCVVNMPITLGEIEIDANVYADVDGDKYMFRNAEVVCGGLRVDIRPVEKFDVLDKTAEYPEILGLADIVKNGMIYGNVQAFDMNVDVMFDIATTSLRVENDMFAVTLKDQTVYAQLGAIKLKLALSDAKDLLSLLGMTGVADVSMPQMSLDEILTLLGNIETESTDNGVMFKLGVDEVAVAVYLAVANNGWNVEKATLTYKNNVITIAVKDAFADSIPNVNAQEYSDVTDLVQTFVPPVLKLTSASSYGLDFNVGLTLGGQRYNAAGTFVYDSVGNVSVDLTLANANAKLVNANVVYANDTVYLTVNGIKAAFKTDGMNVSGTDVAGAADLEQIVNKIYGLDENIDELIDAVVKIGYAVKNFDISNVDLSKIDFASIVKSFEFENGKLAVTVDAGFVGLDVIDLALANNGGNLSVAIGGIADIDAEATVIANVKKVKLPDANDYVLKLAGNVENVDFAIAADFTKMDVLAEIRLGDVTVNARYFDGVIYAKVGAVSLAADINNIGTLVAQLTAIIGGDSNVDLRGLTSFDMSLQSVLDALNIDLSQGRLSIGLDLEGLGSVNVIFDENAQFDSITADVQGAQLVINQSAAEITEISLDGEYVSVEKLAAQVIDIYNNYKGISANGIAAGMTAKVEVNGKTYDVEVDVRYNKGLYADVEIWQGNTKLVTLNMYYVNNAIYVDVNGLRVATKLSAINSGKASAGMDVASMLGVLSQAKGYNAVLDSVIAVIEQLPNRINDIDYIALLTSLTYNNDTLTAIINGEQLGISEFTVEVNGRDELNVGIYGLKIGDVTLKELNVNATPRCGEVTEPNANEYVSELEVEVMGMTVNVKLDLYNKQVTGKTTLLGHEMAIYYADGVVYVTYGEVKAQLKVTEIDKLVGIISTIADIELPSVEMPEIKVSEILAGISKETNADGYSVGIAIGGVKAVVNFNGEAKLTNANVTVGDVAITARVTNGVTYPALDTNANYVDLVALVETYAADVRNIINAAGYDITVNGSFDFDGNVYKVDANVKYNGGLFVDANVWYNTAYLINVQLWYVDDILYVAAGDFRLAVEIPQTTSTNGSADINLAQYKGYNPYVDGVLDIVQNVIDKFTANEVDYIALIGGLTFADGQLTLTVNGRQLGLEQFAIQLSANDALTAKISNLAAASLNANADVTIKACNTAVTAPSGDFTTDLSIVIDDKNTLYVNLDLINGVFNFRLDDLYAVYADNIIKINKGDIYVSGNITDIVSYVKRIDELVNEFSGATESTALVVNFDSFKNIDLKAIAQSLSIVTVGEKATLSASLFGFDVQAILVGGSINTVKVPVSMINKTLKVEPCKAWTHGVFDGDGIEYIAIDGVLGDYLPTIENLVHTNSWKFNFEGDTELTLSGTTYKVAAGSYIEFYYKNTEGMATFKLRAKLDIHKKKSDGSWQPYIDLDVVYRDGNIYVTEHGRQTGTDATARSELKLTISVDTIKRTLSLYDDLVAVVPQIGELVESIKSAMNEAESNAENISFSTILNDVSYVGGVFGLDLNGQSLLSKLTTFSLTAQTYDNGSSLSLNEMIVNYDNIFVKVNNLRVYASEVDAAYAGSENDAKWNEGGQYKAVQDIYAYNTEVYHIDLNSLYELLSSFVITATPKEDNNGARSFYIDGTASVTLALGKMTLADIPIGLSVKVDITPDNKVYISAKVSRTEPEGALLKIANLFNVKVYEDKGGDSYLYYDGVNETFTVIRNSIQAHTYCSWCKSYSCTESFWHAGGRSDKKLLDTEYYGYPTYKVENLSSADFTANIMEYIMALFNFGSTIKDPIVEAMNTPNNNDFGIDDILSDYAYSEAESKYSVKANLAPISDQLGTLTVGILHKEDYSLTQLTVDVDMLSGMCKANVPFVLKDSVCGEATNIVKQTTLW